MGATNRPGRLVGALSVAISSIVFPTFRQDSMPMALSLIAAAVVMLLLQAR